MFDYLSFKDKTLLVTSDKLKSKIREEIMSYNQLLDIKIMSISELKNRLLFEPLNSAFTYIYQEYKKPLSIINTLIDYMYYIDDEKEYKSSKINELKNIKNYLIKNNHFKLDKRFIQNLKQYDIKFIGFPIITKEIQFIFNKLKKLNFNIEILEYYSEYYNHKITHLDTLENEVIFVADSIVKLLENNIDINSIKLANVNDDYTIYLKRIFANYNIPINLKENTTLFSLPLSNIFINYLKENSKEETINLLKENYPNYIDYINLYINILNKYSYLNNIDLELIKYELKNTRIKNNKRTNSIEIIDIDEIGNSSNYIFVMSCNYNELPKIIKDEDYLLDQEKEELNISTSKDINKNNIEKIKKLIHSSKNIYLTYKDKSYFNEYHKVDFLNELKEENYIKNIFTSYSENEDKISLTKRIDNYIFDENTSILKGNYDINYSSYSNKFNGISKETLNKALNQNKFNISYSNLNTFYECPFKFYISNLLKLSKNEPSTYAIIGKIMHAVIQNCYNTDFDFEAEFEKQKNIFTKDSTLKDSELFFIDNIKSKTKDVCDFLLSHEDYTLLKNHFHEHYIELKKEFNNFTFIIKGYIDKLIFEKINDKYYAAIIDLKTGSTAIEPSIFKYGLSLQVPFYLYLLRRDTKETRFNDACILGLYIHNILNKVNDEKSLKYNGLTIDNKEVLHILDSTYQSSSLITGLSIKNDGEFKNLNRIIKEEDLNNLENLIDSKIDEFLSDVFNCNFNITSKIDDKTSTKKDLSCKYCEYKAICYKTSSDTIYLNSKKGEDNNGLD